MSFRNADFINNDSDCAQPRKKASLRKSEQSPLEKTIGRIASVIVDLHEGFLSKCANLEIFRNLSTEEQDLL